jgi:hypothetical protein
MRKIIASVPLIATEPSGKTGIGLDASVTGAE